MSKVGGALPSWYWPDNIPRRVAVPEQPIDRGLRYRGPSVAGKPAIVAREGSTTYRELLAAVRETARGIHSIDPEGTAAAVVEADFAQSLILLLAALAAGKQVFVGDPLAPLPVLARQLEESRATIVLTAADPGAAGTLSGVRIVRRPELPAGTDEPPGSGHSSLPAVLIASRDDLVVHSHFALSAMAVSLTTFVPQLRAIPYVAISPLSSWEGLCASLAGLLHGSFLVPASLSALDQAPPEVAGGYTLLRREDIDALLSAGRPPALLSKIRYLFVSTNYFHRRWRQRVEGLLGRPILPIWGTPEVGLAVAAHPTWFPLEAHGIPMVNVFLQPVDPVRGVISEVPWEMLEGAEIGVDTPSGMIGFSGDGRTESMRLGNILRTHTLASVDHVGVVTLLPSGGGGT